MTRIKMPNGRGAYVLLQLPAQVLNPKIGYPAFPDDTPIEGLDPNLKYLPIWRKDPPDYDPVHFVVNWQEGHDTEGNRWIIEGVVSGRPKAEAKALAENVLRMEVQKHSPPEDFPRDVISVITSLVRKNKGILVGPEEEAILDKWTETGSILKRNEQNLERIKQQIDAGEKPAITEGYEAAAQPLP